jgi:phage baseplate assembly protein W
MANGITYGLHFPFLKSPVGSYVRATENTEDEIKSNLLHLLLTRRGTRYYLPDFGTRLYEFIFEPLDAQTFNAMKDEIYEQVRIYIPNLTITNISIIPYTEVTDAQEPRPRLAYNPKDFVSTGEFFELFEQGETLTDKESAQYDIIRIPGPNTADYTAKIKIEYIDESSAFGSRNFVIINI